MAGRAFEVAIVGAGNVGLALARMLDRTGDYAVRVSDCTEEACGRALSQGFRAVRLDASNATRLSGFIAGADAVVAAVPDRLVGRVAESVAAAGRHYLDFSIADAAMAALAAGARDAAFLPGCGVSPGLVDSVVAHFLDTSEGGIDVAVAVGAIPARRTNRLGYSLIWNLDGLFSEYTSPCEAIEDSRLVAVPALSNRIDLDVGGQPYEAFCTAGVMGAMKGFAGGRLRSLICRTIRYPGHLDYLQLLLDDLGLRHRKDLLNTVLRNGLTDSQQDVVLLHAAMNPGRPDARALEMRIEAQADEGSSLAAGSAAHAAFLLDELASGAGAPDGAQAMNRAPDGAQGMNRAPDAFGRFLKSRFAAPLVTVREIAVD